MIVFVNCKSGGGYGEKFLRRFKQILNPGQVFDIANTGPAVGYVCCISNLDSGSLPIFHVWVWWENWDKFQFNRHIH